MTRESLLQAVREGRVTVSSGYRNITHNRTYRVHMTADRAQAAVEASPIVDNQQMSATTFVELATVEEVNRLPNWVIDRIDVEC